MRVRSFFALILMCFVLSSCLGQSNDEAFRQEIDRDTRLVGDWQVLKWSDIQVETCQQCQSISVAEGKQDGNYVYMLLTDHEPYKSDLRGNITVYQFGNAHYLLTGYPDGGCAECHLVKYDVKDDVLKVSVMDVEKAAEFLTQSYPQQTGFEYKTQDVTSITAKDLSQQTTEIFDDLAQQPDLWNEMIILKRK